MRVLRTTGNRALDAELDLLQRKQPVVAPTLVMPTPVPAPSPVSTGVGVGGGSAADPQVAGVYDEGSAEWAVRTVPSVGNLLPVPFVFKDLILTNVASSDFAYGAAFGFNSDLSGSSVHVSLAAGANFAIIEGRLRGRMVGVRWTHYNASTRDPFGVIIDGVAYDVPVSLHDVRSNVANTTSWMERAWVCPELLPDTEHAVEIVFVGNAAATRTWDLLGWLVDARAGYRPVEPRGWLIGTALLTGAAATFATLGFGDYHVMDRLVFLNTDVAARTVSLTFGSTVWWQQTIAAGAVAEWTPPYPIAFDGAVSWKAHADVTSVVRMAVFGRHV